jgi:hypothetical protein
MNSASRVQSGLSRVPPAPGGKSPTAGATSRRGQARASAPARRGALDKKGSYVGQASATRPGRDWKHELRSVAAMCLEGEAVATCGHRISGQWEAYGEKAAVYRKGRFGHFWSGVQQCGSVWACPVCAAKIARARALQVAETVSKFQEAGGNVGMLTLTQSHERADSLETHLTALKDRWRRMKGQRFWKDAVKAGELVGGVTGTEVTDSATSGWHPHLHVLLYLRKNLPLDRACELLMKLEAAWCEMATADGFVANPAAQHFRFATTGKAAGDYVTKFGVEWEITHGHQKTGNGSRTPWDILRAINETAPGPERAALVARFREYFAAFKGKKQLTPFGLVREEWGQDPEDEEIANTETRDEREASVVFAVSTDTIRAIARRKLFGAIDEAYSASGMAGVMAVMSNAGLPPPWPGCKASEVARVPKTGRTNEMED